MTKQFWIAPSWIIGLVVVAGGKYTTYRVMAKDAVDAAVHSLDAKVPESCTEDVPLLGAEGFHALTNATARLATQSGLHKARIEHLLGRYGSLIQEVLGVASDDPTLTEPLAGAPDYLRAEVVYAASHEGGSAAAGRRACCRRARRGARPGFACGREDDDQARIARQDREGLRPGA